MATKKIVSYYLSHFREGQNVKINLDSIDESVKRIETSVKLKVIAKVGDNLSEEEVRQRVALFGPQDILGIKKEVILKAYPTPNDGNFNHLDVPFLEFDELDFLWRYSTAKLGAKWMPWLSLIVLKAKNDSEQHEFEELPRIDRNLPPRIKCTEHFPKIDLTASWRWSHVQVNAVEGLNLEQIKAIIKNNPRTAICRQVCPRKLKKKTKYTAFLVPTYKLGLEAAKGEFDTDSNRTTLSWTIEDGMTNVELPYYHKWEFHTGSTGDFEQTLRLIEAKPIANLGGRPIDINNPGYGLLNQEEESRIIEIDGALQSSDQNEDIPNPLEQEEIEELARVINSAEVTDEQGNPVLDKDGNQKLRLVPPIYGRWINYREDRDVNLRTNENNLQEHWLEMLNLDLRYRIAAGLGVQYVKENQEALMEEAWKQLKKVKEENAKLNRARFGREISNCLHKRIVKAKDTSIVDVASAASTTFLVNDHTLKAQLKESKVPNTVANLKSWKYFANSKTLPLKGVNRTTHPLANSKIRVANVVQTQLEMGIVKSKNDKQDPLTPISRAEGLRRFVASNIEEIKEAVNVQLAPANTIEKRVCQNIEALRTWETQHQNQAEEQNPDPLRPLFAYPEFHAPMYKYLKELSEYYLIPGIENIPQNCVSALVTNRKFIEAFMIGLNHEFAAELRWRGYPTDLRGSYFRNFWEKTIYSVDEKEQEKFRTSKFGIKLKEDLQLDWEKIENAINVPEDFEIAQQYEQAIEQWLLTRDEDKDIAAFEARGRWRRRSRLGAHSVGDSDRENELVLLIRAEVFKKFPNTLIYLAQKHFNNAFMPLEQFKPIYPIFEMNLPPDILGLGFPMTEAQARRHFIVFEERNSEERFGLDAEGGNELHDLSWEHFDTGKEDFLNNTPPTGNEAESQWQKATFIPKAFVQKPVRMAIDLDTLLP